MFMEEFIAVEELMVPLEEYATVSEEASLFEAVMALEAVHEKMDREKYHYLHRAILVYDGEGKIVGKIGQIDVLRALEPRYKDLGDTRAMSRAGLSPEFIRSMMDNMAFCDTSLTDMCGKASRIQVRDFMYTPEAGECVEADASLCEAIHMLIMGKHQKLLVLREGDIVGVLRLSDVFMKIFEMMKQCET
jgi:CBS domain-containing protein